MAVVLTALLATSCGGPGAPDARPSPATTTAVPTTASPPPSLTPSVAPSPTPTAAATTIRPTTRPPSPMPTPTPSPADRVVAFRGLGTWVDGFDWSPELKGTVQPDVVDDIAAQGVRTLYLQAAREHPDVPGPLLKPDLLGRWLERAHARGLRVVAWYLPTFTDPDADWARLRAIVEFRSHGHAFDALGVDIESRDLTDVRLRNERLVALSARLRGAYPALPLLGIVLPPVVTEVVNTAYWPGFPWRGIAPYYDAWTPMAYYTNRTADSGWRDAYRYVAENVRRTRANLGLPDAVVHAAGGIGDESTTADVDGLVRAARDTRCVGGSLYDYATTARALWAGMRRVPS